MVRLERFLRTVSLYFFITRTVLPFLGRVLFLAFRLMMMAVISLWIGVPRSLDNIANEWLDRAVIAGFPTQWDRQLYYIMWSLGLLAVITGWVIFSFVTVWIVRLIF